MRIYFFGAKDPRPEYQGDKIFWAATIERADEAFIRAELADFIRPFLVFVGSVVLDPSWVNDHWGAQIEAHGYACVWSRDVPDQIRVQAVR